MKATFSPHRHSHFIEDFGSELPLLGLGGAVLFITTIAVYLYAATI